MQEPEIASPGKARLFDIDVYASESNSLAIHALENPIPRATPPPNVGRTRRPAVCSLPSAFKSIGPTIPISDALLRTPNNLVSVSLLTPQSGFKNSTLGAWVAVKPMLQALAK